ncbi:hypothetical protein [Streptomyces californicus]|uniref:hypothetical protein n=1 Tax=Streptomyces californicus TaxID=67351 RepID=UPI00370FA733
MNAPDSQWVNWAREDDRYGEHYDAFLDSIRDAPRVRLGRHYTLPGSIHPGMESSEGTIAGATRSVTHLLWDGPVMTSELADDVLSTLLSEGTDASCSAFEEIAALLRESAGARVIPVWM